MSSLSLSEVKKHDFSKEEDDLKARSSKKVKGGEHEFSNSSSQPVSYADMVAGETGEEANTQRRSFKDTVLGKMVGVGEVLKEVGEDATPEEVEETVGRITIIEK